ncbi:hypothetical protein D9611_012634 [Ephemerocybe angulata]|uniref:Uncharacterized protein n=1 Tax=Ephemerocybe angulata TaxID=980116 RepID=A0A8H5AUK1_9AGAR|nr:hypothetical protein D9611_012634 [Tulosesus angulatus]
MANPIGPTNFYGLHGGEPAPPTLHQFQVPMQQTSISAPPPPSSPKITFKPYPQSPPQPAPQTTQTAPQTVPQTEPQTAPQTAPQVTQQPTEKRKPGRPRKSTTTPSAKSAVIGPKRPRGRPPKVKLPPADPSTTDATPGGSPATPATAPVRAAPTLILGPDGLPVKRGRGRPRKNPISVSAQLGEGVVAPPVTMSARVQNHLSLLQKDKEMADGISIVHVNFDTPAASASASAKPLPHRNAPVPATATQVTMSSQYVKGNGGFEADMDAVKQSLKSNIEQYRKEEERSEVERLRAEVKGLREGMKVLKDEFWRELRSIREEVRAGREGAQGMKQSTPSTSALSESIEVDNANDGPSTAATSVVGDLDLEYPPEWDDMYVDNVAQGVAGEPTGVVEHEEPTDTNGSCTFA